VLVDAVETLLEEPLDELEVEEVENEDVNVVLEVDVDVVLDVDVDDEVLEEEVGREAKGSFQLSIPPMLGSLW